MSMGNPGDGRGDDETRDIVSTSTATEPVTGTGWQAVADELADALQEAMLRNPSLTARGWIGPMLRSGGTNAPASARWPSRRSRTKPEQGPLGPLGERPDVDLPGTAAMAIGPARGRPGQPPRGRRQLQNNCTGHPVATTQVHRHRRRSRPVRQGRTDATDLHPRLRVVDFTDTALRLDEFTTIGLRRIWLRPGGRRRPAGTVRRLAPPRRRRPGRPSRRTSNPARYWPRVSTTTPTVGDRS
jgi:hypothetical protein